MVSRVDPRQVTGTHLMDHRRGNPVGLLVLTVIAAGLVVIGLGGVRRRDLEST